MCVNCAIADTDQIHLVTFDLGHDDVTLGFVYC